MRKIGRHVKEGTGLSARYILMCISSVSGHDCPHKTADDK